MLEEEANLPDDLAGISAAIKDDHFDVVCTITTNNVNNWSFHFSGDEHNKTHKLEDLPEFKELIPELKECEGFLTPESFERAVAEFNAQHANKHELANWFRGKCGIEALPPSEPIKKDALKRLPDGGLELKTKDISRSELKELFKLWIVQSKIDKQNAKSMSARMTNSGARIEPAAQRLG
jgi:hypothetical protein